MLAAALSAESGCSGGDNGRPSSRLTDTTGDPSSTGSSSADGGQGGAPVLSGDGDASSSSSGDGDASSSSSGDGETEGTSSAPECGGFDCGIGTCDATKGYPACLCPEGYGGAPCVDIDECAELEQACPGQACINTPGGFYCECAEGSVDQGQGCETPDPCALGPCDESAQCAVDASTVEGYSCTCNEGSFGSGWTCSSIDTCAGDPCSGSPCLATEDGPLCQCTVGNAGRRDCDQSCATLDLVDTTLKRNVAALFGPYQDPDAINPAVDLVSKKELYVASGSIETLDGLQCWSNLKSLVINSSELGSGADDTPLEAIASLNQLERLDLRCADLSDLSALSGHPTLRSLSISMENCPEGENQPPDLTPLATIPRLEVLDLGGLGLSNLDGLAGSKNLRTVFAARNALTSIDGLKDNSGLRELVLDDNELTQFDALLGLTQLVRIEARNNPLTDASFISELPSLQKVLVSGAALSQIPSLANNAALRVLDLRGNPLDGLQGISEAPALGVLDLSDTGISSLSDLVDSAFDGLLAATDNSFDCEAMEDDLRALREQGVELLTDCSLP